MSSNYRLPTSEEKQLGQGLVGSKIEIFWDGDNVYYPCVITGYEKDQGKYSVVYEGDDTGDKYVEDLKVSTWRIWGGSEGENGDDRNNKVSPSNLITD